MITAFLGKGGVGKTSVAAAYALACAEKGKTAIVSTDFMPSLKHIFKVEYDNLTVVELSEEEVSRSWRIKYGDQVMSVLDEFVKAEDWMMGHISESPGVAEEFMISNIVEMDESGEYDNIIWDTAASSSTMHLLLLQKEFYNHLDRDIKMYLRFRDTLRRSETVEILEQWKDLANRVWSRLTESRLLIVTTMDELSLLQAEEIDRDTNSMGLSLDGKIYNRCGQSKEAPYDGVASIPELDGSATEIVLKMKEYLTALSGDIQENDKRSLL